MLLLFYADRSLHQNHVLMGHATPDVTLGIYTNKQTTENIRAEFIEALNKSKGNLVFVDYAV